MLRTLKRINNDFRRDSVQARIDIVLNEQNESRRRFKRDLALAQAKQDRKEQMFAQRIAALEVERMHLDRENIELALLDHAI